MNDGDSKGVIPSVFSNSNVPDAFLRAMYTVFDEIKEDDSLSSCNLPDSAQIEITRETPNLHVIRGGCQDDLTNAELVVMRCIWNHKGTVRYDQLQSEVQSEPLLIALGTTLTSLMRREYLADMGHGFYKATVSKHEYEVAVTRRFFHEIGCENALDFIAMLCKYKVLSSQEIDDLLTYLRVIRNVKDQKTDDE